MNTMYKYRPTSIDEFVFADSTLERTIRRYASGKTNLPLVMYGKHGTGKSLLSQLIPQAIDGADVVITEINAEDLNSSAEVRKQFFRESHFDKLFPPKDQSKHYTVVEEVNFDTKAKGALRVCIDRMAERDLMIFTTNELERLDKGLLSRAEKVEVRPVTAEQFLPRAQMILRSEGLEHDDKDILEILESVYDLHADNREFYKVLDEIIDVSNDEANHVSNLNQEQA
jgi:replication-associated recombination protein RarA